MNSYVWAGSRARKTARQPRASERGNVSIRIASSGQRPGLGVEGRGVGATGAVGSVNDPPGRGHFLGGVKDLARQGQELLQGGRQQEEVADLCGPVD